MWHGIYGHDDVVEAFRRSLVAGRLASTYLFVGPDGVGKRTFALRLAQALLCQAASDDGLQACETCESCRLIAAGNHPDLLLLAKPEGKSYIPLELFLGRPQHRMDREGLCHDIALKPFLGGRKVAIIDDADYFNAEGANSLLKTLEEPPPRSVLILIGTSAARQLPTIRSRCQIVRFGALPSEAIVELLIGSGAVADREQAGRLVACSGGSVSRAIALADPPLQEFRRRLHERLAGQAIDRVRLTREIAAFVDEAGAEAAPRRERLRQVIGFAVEYFRQVMRAASGAAAPEDKQLEAAAQQAVAAWCGSGATAASCLDLCLSALEHVDRNVNPATLIQWWIDEIGQTVLRGEPAGTPV